MELRSVLVTGGAGDIGRGIAKILRDVPWVGDVHGMDISGEFPAAAYYRDFVTGPTVRDPGYLDFLGAQVERLGVDLVIPMSEPEIRHLGAARVTEVGGAPVLMPSARAMDVGFDKLATARFLEDSGLPFPWTVVAADTEPVALPCIMKSRSGSGSKSVHVVTEENAARLREQTDGMIYQELLSTDDDEYTCGLFRSAAGSVATIVFRRRLVGGRTGYARVVRDPAIEQLLHDLAERLDLVGSINVQLRRTDRGPVVFEINPRFSSTVVFRHLLGFQDVAWAVLDRFGALGAIDFDPEAVAGKQIFRADDEIVW